MKSALRFVLATALVALWCAPAYADHVQLGRSITVEEGENGGDLVCIGCSITLRGDAGDVVAIGGRVDVSGSTRGDVVVVGGRLHLAPSASVKGDAVAVGGRLEREAGSQVGGEVTNVGGFGGFAGAGLFGLMLLLLIPSAVFGFIIALIAYAIMGEPRVRLIAWTIQNETGQVVLAGVACIAALVLLCFFVGHSHVGPLLLVACVVFLILAVTGYTGLSYFIGGKASAGSSGAGRVLLGALIICVLQIIPIVNIVTVAFVLLALGGAIVSGFGGHSRMIAPPPPMPTAVGH